MVSRLCMADFGVCTEAFDYLACARMGSCSMRLSTTDFVYTMYTNTFCVKEASK